MAGAAVVTTTVLPVISLVKREFILHLTTKAKCIPVGKMSFEKSRTNQQLEKVTSVYLRWPNTVSKCLCLIHHNFETIYVLAPVFCKSQQ